MTRINFGGPSMPVQTFEFRFLSKGMINPMPRVLSLGPVSSTTLQAWGCLPLLTSSLKVDQAKIPNQCTWLKFLGKELKGYHLTNDKPKASPLYRKNQSQSHYIVWGKQGTPKRQVGQKEEGGEFLTHCVTVIDRFPCSNALSQATQPLLKRWEKRAGNAHIRVSYRVWR